jgi:hypothetical protein
MHVQMTLRSDSDGDEQFKTATAKFSKKIDQPSGFGFCFGAAVVPDQFRLNVTGAN